MENPKGTDRLRAQRFGLTSRLEKEIGGLKLHETRILVIGGCQTGWSDFTTFRWGSSETEDQIREREVKETAGLEAQHSSECSGEHSIVKVKMRLDKNVIALAKYKAKFLVHQLNEATGFKT